MTWYMIYGARMFVGRVKIVLLHFLTMTEEGVKETILSPLSLSDIFMIISDQPGRWIAK